MNALRNVWALLLATAITWLCVAVIGEISSSEFVQGVAAIFALIGTVTIWTMWALDYYGISVDGSGSTARQQAMRAAEYEKPKRETDLPADARVALLLSLLTPDERDTIRARLVDELSADGEIVTLADLLTDQEQNAQRAERKS